MKQYLETLSAPTENNLNKIKNEIERSEIIIGCIINRGELNDKEIGALEYEEDYIKECKKLRTKIATILTQKLGK